MRKKDIKRINQNFIQIPLLKIKERIKYLCLINDIKYTEINESYTSICSFYDNEEIKKQETYQEKSKPERKDIISFLRNIGQTVPIRQKIKFN